MADPKVNVEIMPSMIDIRDVEGPPDHVGGHFHWTYKMAGVKFDGWNPIEVEGV